MKKIEAKNWFINDNDLMVSLLHLYVKIKIKKDDDLTFKLIVIDQKMEELILDFQTLEDAIKFTEDVLTKCLSKEDALLKYHQMKERDTNYLQEDIKVSNKNTIILNIQEIKEILANYFGNKKEYAVSITDERYKDFYGKEQTGFYITEHISYNGLNRDHSYMLTEGDIRNALSSYVESQNYELIDYNYLEDVDKDDKTFNFKGIELSIIPKKIENNKSLIKK